MKKNLRALKVKDEMTAVPEVVELDDGISRAIDLMRQHGIRHLPVLSDDKLVGLVSDRGLKAARLSSWSDRFVIADVMIPEPFTVTVDTDLDDVIRKMIDDKVGSVVVLDKRGKTAGIFTTIDALRVLHGLLENRKPKRATPRRRRLKLLRRAG